MMLDYIKQLKSGEDVIANQAKIQADMRRYASEDKNFLRKGPSDRKASKLETVHQLSKFKSKSPISYK